MTNNEREMGEILTRLTEIERRLTIAETDRREDHRAIVRISEAMVTLAAKFPNHSAIPPAPPAPAPVSSAATVGAAAGVVGGAVISKILSYFGIS